MTEFPTLEDVIADWPFANQIANDPTHADDDRIKRVGDPSFHTVGELRTAMASASGEQLRAFERELGRRDAGFMRIVSTDANLGTGTYEARTPAGQTARKPFAFTGDTITTPVFAAPVSGGGPKKGQVSAVTPTPDPYAKDLAERRAAEATPESTFENRWRADRTRELAAEHARLAAHSDAHRTEMLRAAEGQKSYPPPDPFSAGLKALREKESR